MFKSSYLTLFTLTTLVACGNHSRSVQSIADAMTPVEPVEPKVEASLRGRAEFGQKLRETYLDQSENIVVKVNGKENEKIELSYILIGDVWMHHFLKEESNMNSLRKMGFKTLILSNKSIWWKFDVASGDYVSAGWYDGRGREVTDKRSQ